jgi:sugar lactone lactonase YvrE
MRARSIAVAALCASALAWGAACSGKGHHDETTIITRNSFPQGFLPALLGGASGRGDVALRPEGDLFAVDGGSDVISVSRQNGETNPSFAHASGANLLSIVPADDGRLFAGDDQGRIWVIPFAGGAASLLTDNGGVPIDTGDQPITGLAFAPSGFGDLAGSLLAAAGTNGIVRITTISTPTSTPPVSPSATPFAPVPATGDRYIDLAFSGTTLFALNATLKRIETMTTTGSVTSFQTGFSAPVGLAADSVGSEIYVADAGDDILKTVPVAGGTTTKRARYHFDASAPSGIACDQIGSIAFITESPFAIRGANLPRIDPALQLRFSVPNVGYGDLEFDRVGGFVLVANLNDPNSTTDTTNNFLFGVERVGSAVTTLASQVGASNEDLLGVAIDPVTQDVYFSTRAGNVFKRTSTGSGTPELLVNVTNVPVLGLELAPSTFGAFAGDLIATTSDGRVFAIDPASPNPPVAITLSPSASRLSDLVFSSQGDLYLVDNGASTSHILHVSPPANDQWTVNDLGAPAGQLGQPDGIDIDEGADRLLVTKTGGGDQLIAVALGPNPPAGTVTGVASIDIDDAFFPTGIVYDRLGTVVYHAGNSFIELRAVSVSP